MEEAISEEDISEANFSEEDISETGFSEEDISKEYIQSSLRKINISGTHLRKISEEEIHFL